MNINRFGSAEKFPSARAQVVAAPHDNILSLDDMDEAGNRIEVKREFSYGEVEGE